MPVGTEARKILSLDVMADNGQSTVADVIAALLTGSLANKSTNNIKGSRNRRSTRYMGEHPVRPARRGGGKAC